MSMSAGSVSFKDVAKLYQAWQAFDKSENSTFMALSKLKSTDQEIVVQAKKILIAEDGPTRENALQDFSSKFSKSQLEDLRSFFAEAVLEKHYHKPFLEELPDLQVNILHALAGKPDHDKQAIVVKMISEWVEKLPKEDRKLAVKALTVLQTSLKALPPFMGVTTGNLAQVISFFTTEVHKLSLKSLEGIGRMGLDAKEVTDETIHDVYDMKSKERYEALERELAPHLLNPKMAALYAAVCSEHASLLEQESQANIFGVLDLEKKAVLWSKFAMDKGNADGCFVIIDHLVFGDWKDPVVAYDRAMVYVRRALELNVPEARLWQAHLFVRRYQASPKNKQYEQAAINGYRQIGGNEGIKGLHDLMQVTGVGGEALVEAIKKKYSGFSPPKVEDVDLKYLEDADKKVINVQYLLTKLTLAAPPKTKRPTEPEKSALKSWFSNLPSVRTLIQKFINSLFSEKVPLRSQAPRIPENEEYDDNNEIDLSDSMNEATSRKRASTVERHMESSNDEIDLSLGESLAPKSVHKPYTPPLSAKEQAKKDLKERLMSAVKIASNEQEKLSALVIFKRKINNSLTPEEKAAVIGDVTLAIYGKKATKEQSEGVELFLRKGP